MFENFQNGLEGKMNIRSIQLETNHNKGYDMELGCLDARAELADKLLEKIEKIKPELTGNFQI